jgi:multiple sugar transport system substrate-binding protein
MIRRRLNCMTWDHPRGYDPLAGNLHLFSGLHPDIEIVWSRRSLRDFGIQSIEMLSQHFDIIVIDHPFCGRAKATGCLLDLQPLFPRDFLDMLAEESVGPSTRSYSYGGGIWGLPTDAAAQVASYRPDLLSALGFDAPPSSFAEVLKLGKVAQQAGKTFALPACQTDASCLVASLAANLGAPIPEDGAQLLPADIFGTVLDALEELLALSHAFSIEWNPIQAYNAMSSGNDIVYIPFAFGYSNYARRGVRQPLRFTTVAGPGPDPAAGAILGGAGCAISAHCQDIEAAIAYLSWMHQPEHQAGAYFGAGGQPGLRRAWTDPAVDREASGFFSGSLETLDKAYLRPRFDGFIDAFEHLGLLVHRWLTGDRSLTRTALIQSVNAVYARARDGARA